MRTCSHDGGDSERAGGRNVLGRRAAGDHRGATGYTWGKKGAGGGRRRQIVDATAGGRLASIGCERRLGCKVVVSSSRRPATWSSRTLTAAASLYNYNEEGGDPYLLAVAKLVRESDGVLQGVLSQGNRQGSAAPSLRSQNCPAKITPVKGKSLRAAVALSVNRGGPQEYPLQAAMVALGLQWMPLRRQGTGSGEARAGEQSQRAPQLLKPEWLVGAEGDAKATRRRVSCACMVGFSARGGEAGVRTCTAAQFLAEVSGRASLAVSGRASLAGGGRALLAVSGRASLAVSGRASLAVSGRASLAVSGRASLAVSGRASLAVSGRVSLAGGGRASLAVCGRALLAGGERASLAASGRASLAVGS
eukprot:97934-Pleurochrysis_carterae.AAC.1